MEKELLENLIADGNSIRRIAKKLGKGATTIRYWLDKHSIVSGVPRKYKCKCGETNPANFYGNKKSVCSSCHNDYTRLKSQEKRTYALSRLGGCCIICGYDKYPCSLDIHHLDPSVKDEKFNGMRGWSYERIDKEISTCVLLCRNCHSAHHSGYIDLNISESGSMVDR